jgi:hypothetical protein
MRCISLRQRKAWELLGKMETEGDHRGSIVALREVRECVESIAVMVTRAAEVAQEHQPMTITIQTIGEAPLHEWEELPATCNSLLPDNPQGKLYLVRPHVAQAAIAAFEAKLNS